MVWWCRIFGSPFGAVGYFDVASGTGYIMRYCGALVLGNDTGGRGGGGSLPSQLMPCS